MLTMRPWRRAIIWGSTSRVSRRAPSGSRAGRAPSPPVEFPGPASPGKSGIIDQEVNRPEPLRSCRNASGSGPHQPGRKRRTRPPHPAATGTGIPAHASRASARAMASPIPRLAPVTIALLPLSGLTSSAPSGVGFVRRPAMRSTFSLVKKTGPRGQRHPQRPWRPFPPSASRSARLPTRPRAMHRGFASG